MSIVMICLMIGQAYALDISKIELNQALGVQKDNHFNFVAGKDTVVRAFLSEEVAITADQTWAKVSKDGTQVVQLAPKSYDKPVKIVDFLCPTLQDCGSWAAGNYSFEVSVNNVVKKEPADGSSTTYKFQERKEVRVLALAVKANYGSTVVPVADEKWKTMWRFTASVYPVAASKLKWEMRDELDASADKFNLETENGRQELWQALTNLMPSTCSANPKSDGCYDLIVGFIQARPKGYPNGTLQGYTYGKPSNIVVASDEDAPATVAHEIAHVYGIGDTYDGGSLRCSVNPSPDGFKGKDWDTNNETSCSAGRVAYPEVSATKIPADQNPYEVGGRGALGDMACYMGSGGLQKQFWTTQETYDWLFTQFAPTSTKRFKREPSRMIDFLGYIKKDDSAVQIEPWKSFTDSSTVACTAADTTGYWLAALSESGEVLASQKLDIRFWTLNNPPEPIDPAPFKGAMCFPDGVVKFQIKKGDTVLKEVPVSANAPTISLTATPSNPTGKFTIKWTASDADAGDSLTYKVEYTPNAADVSKWMVLEDGLEAPQWEEDFSELPGGTNAKIRVTATDGVLSATAESSAFTVPVKSPEVFLDDPEWGNSYEDGDQVELEGETYDLQDERLPDNKLEWSSNLGNKSGSKIIGYGSRLIVSNLLTGEHTITLKATNSAGKATVSNPLTIYVGNISNQYSDANPSGDLTVSNNYKNLNTTVKVPKASIVKNSFVMFEALKKPSSATSPTNVPTTGLPANYRHIGRYFSLTAETEEGDDNWTEVGDLGKINLSIATGQLNNIDPATLGLYRWDDVQKKWVSAVSGCGTSSVNGNTLSVQICKFGEFSVIGTAPQPVVPDTGGGGYYIPPTPSAPTIGVSISGVSVSLSWPAVASAKGYKLLYRFDFYGLFTTIDIGNVSSFSQELWEGIEFDVAIKAYNEYGDGEASEVKRIKIPKTHLHIGIVGDDLKMKIPCAEYKGNQYEMSLVPDSVADLTWGIDLASFKQIYGKGANCLAVGDNLNLKLDAEYNGSQYSFILNHSGGLFWKMDKGSFKKN